MENKKEEYRIPDFPYQPVQDFSYGQRETETQKTKVKQSRAEGAIGKIVMTVFSCVFVFIGLVFLIVLAAPYMQEWLKVGGMYLVSLGMTVTGTVLSLRNKNNRGFLTLASCGMGALYISIVFSRTLFGIFTEFSMYVMIFVWALLCCLLSKIRSRVFLIIGQSGIWIALFVGMIECASGRHTDQALLVLITYLVAAAVFFAAHLKKEYTKNRIGLIALQAGLMTVGFALDSVLRGAPEAVCYWISNIFALVALTPYLLGILVLKKDTAHAVEFSLYSLVYLILFFRFIVLPGTYTGDFVSFGVTVFSLVFLELKFRREQFAGKIVLLALLMVALLAECIYCAPLRQCHLIAAVSLAAILYGFLGKNLTYKIAGLVYGILFCFHAGTSTDDLLHLILGAVLCVFIHFIVTIQKNQYHPAFRILTHLAFLWIIGIDLCGIFAKSRQTGLQNALIVVAVLAAVNTLGAKLPALVRNPKTGEKEKGMRLTAYLANIPLMITALILIGMARGTLMQTLSILLGVAVFAVNSVDIIKENTKTGIALYVMLKWVVLLNVCLYSLDIPGIIISLVGIVYAISGILIGFFLTRKRNLNYLSIRIAGLVLVIINLLKILMIDVNYSTMLFRAVSFLVAGGLCFFISMIYSRVEKKLK